MVFERIEVFVGTVTLGNGGTSVGTVVLGKGGKPVVNVPLRGVGVIVTRTPVGYGLTVPVGTRCTPLETVTIEEPEGNGM